MKEKKIIILTAILNGFIASLKLVMGIVFSFSTLISDSIQSFIDFFTDVISLIVSKIEKRRTNKTYPFGYGQVYYLSNLLTGVLLFLIGCFIIYQIFTVKEKFTPNLTILFILILVLILKMIVIIILHKNSDGSKNEILVEAYKESKADFISTCVVIVVLFISFFERYIPEYLNIDKIGSLFMALYVFYTSVKIIVSNVRSLIFSSEGHDDIKNEIQKELSQFKELRVTKINIIKSSRYYHVFLQIDVNNNIKIKDFIKIEKKIKKQLRSTNKLIKYIDVEPI